MDEVIPFCFLSSSNLNLFDETKAISIPEKKAEKIKIITISETVLKIYLIS